MTRSPASSAACGGGAGLTFAVAAVVALAVAVLHSGHAHQTEPDRLAALVTAVIDGDTIRVTTADEKPLGRVRLLGINAPEIAHPGQAGECFGNEATAALKRPLHPGDMIFLFTDPTQADRDTYGRLLRYVSLDGSAGRTRDDVGLSQIRNGYARARTDSPAVARHARYADAKKAARNHHRGLWRTCGTTGLAHD